MYKRQLPAHLGEKLHIHLVVQEAVHLEHVSVLDYPIPSDAVFQLSLIHI